MAAPSTSTRVTPAGIKLDDGYSTKLTPALDTDISFWEKTVQPPGLDGGDKIPQTTMHNTTYRTYAPRNLIDVTDVQTTVAYDPNVINNILSIINSPGSWTVRFPDGSTMDFFGALRSFQPNALSEGAQPEATIVIAVTNYDPTNNVEAGPVLTSVSGT